MSWPSSGGGGGGGGGPESDPIATPLAEAAQSTADSAVDAAVSATSAAALALAAANAAQDTADDHITDATGAHAATAISGLGTAALLNVGNGANQIVQLNGTAQLPALDGSLLTGVGGGGGGISLAADTWDFDFKLGIGGDRVDIASAGLTEGASGVWTTEAGYAKNLGSGASRWLSHALDDIAEAGDWEIRAEMLTMGTGSQGIGLDWGAGTRGTYLYFYTSASSWLPDSGSTTAAPITIVLAVGSRFIMTVRKRGNTLAWWINEQPAGMVSFSAGYSSLNYNSIHFGGQGGVSNTEETRIYRVAGRAGINAQPVALGLATGGWLA